MTHSAPTSMLGSAQGSAPSSTAQLPACASPALPHGSGAPSPWVTRWAHLLPASAQALDVACGAGRHVRHLAGLGHRLTALEIDPQALAALDDLAVATHPQPVERICADIEAGPWPLPGRQFDAVLVTNYLWRPLLPTLLAAVAPGGWLIYETFAQGQETVGRPRRADFLLAPGELLALTAGWRVVAYEDGFLTAPERFVQRIVAHKPEAETLASTVAQGAAPSAPTPPANAGAKPAAPPADVPTPSRVPLSLPLHGPA